MLVVIASTGSSRTVTGRDVGLTTWSEPAATDCPGDAVSRKYGETSPEAWCTLTTIAGLSADAVAAPRAPETRTDTRRNGILRMTRKTPF